MFGMKFKINRFGLGLVILSGFIIWESWSIFKNTDVLYLLTIGSAALIFGSGLALLIKEKQK